MRTSRSKHHRSPGRALSTKLSLAVLGTTFAVPTLAALSVVALDVVKQRERKKRQAARPGMFGSQVEGSELSIYTDGGTLYDDMIAAIDSAEHSVMMETYIWKNDEAGQRFIDAFNAAARRGVDVYVTYDGFGNLVVPSSFYRQLDDAVNVFRMPAIGRKVWQGPLRYTGLNHSKILVVDDEIGFVGGFNIGSLYAREWRDTHLREVGPVAWGLRQSIARLWNEDRDPSRQIPWTPPPSWDPAVRVAANLPIELVYPIRNMYLRAIERASHRIWIATPYFIPDQQILIALIEASKRGVDVRVMVPEESNHVISDWVSRGFFAQMHRAGITILLYTNSMMHSKTATIDGEWSTIGTANIDRLSLSLNYETNVEIMDPGFAAEMEKVFEADAEQSRRLSSEEWDTRNTLTRAIEWALVPLRPLL